MKNLCTLILLLFSATLFAQEEPTVLFYETFDTQYEEHLVEDMTTDPELKANIILGTDAYKVDGNYYFDSENDKIKLINFEILNIWKESELWPGASKGGVGFLYYTPDEISPDAYRIKLTTKDFQEAYFSAARLETAWWPFLKASYSFDLGVTWQEFSTINANWTIYEGWCHYSFKENLGKQEVVYLKVESDTAFDDVKVVGYHRIINTEDIPSVQLTAYPQDNGIVVQNIPQGKTITVYNAAGVLIATSVAKESKIYIPLYTNGLYIVKVAEKTMKVVL